MKKIVKNMRAAICTVFLIAAVFGAGFYGGKRHHEKNAQIVSGKDTDIKLPTEVEKRVVTQNEVEAKLVEIKELSTYSGEYHVSRTEDYTRYLLDNMAIPGTTNTVSLDCDGIVKVGYDIDKIVVKVDEVSSKIYITLPEPKINDNYIIWDSVECNEKNTILNPINFEEYKSMIADIEADGLKKVEEQGIYQSAEENIKLIIEKFLAEFSEYQVVFM